LKCHFQQPQPGWRWPLQYPGISGQPASAQGAHSTPFPRTGCPMRPGVSYLVRAVRPGPWGTGSCLVPLRHLEERWRKASATEALAGLVLRVQGFRTSQAKSLVDSFWSVPLLSPRT
jgi:hypothetical protein